MTRIRLLTAMIVCCAASLTRARCDPANARTSMPVGAARTVLPACNAVDPVNSLQGILRGNLRRVDRFHELITDPLLDNGALPLAVLEAKIDARIKPTKEPVS